MALGRVKDSPIFEPDIDVLGPSEVPVRGVWEKTVYSLYYVVGTKYLRACGRKWQASSVGLAGHIIVLSNMLNGVTYVLQVSSGGTCKIRFLGHFAALRPCSQRGSSDWHFCSSGMSLNALGSLDPLLCPEDVIYSRQAKARGIMCLVSQTG